MKELTPITVHFGDEFVPTHSNAKRYVVVQTGDQDSCEASQVIKNEGKEALGLPGTTTREDVQKVVGQWTLDRIILAMMNYYGDTTSEGGVYDCLRTNVTKTPSVLNDLGE